MTDNYDAIVKKKFIELLMAGTRELTHLDYKRELYCKGNSENDSKKAEATGYTRLLTHIMGMYNSPTKYGTTFPSINLPNTSLASYIIFGVDYKENKKVITAHPIDKNDEKRCFIDERNLQDQIKERLNYPVAVNYYETLIDETNISFISILNLSWIKPGWYGLLEIVHDNTKGPIFAQSVSDKKPGRSIKNEIANKLYVRKQGVTSTIDSNKPTDQILEQEVYTKFDPKFINYSDRLEDLKKSINPKHKSFQILVTTSTLCAAEKEQKEFLKSLCNVKWNVVFDTHHKTAEPSGTYDFCKDNVTLPIINILPADLARLQDEGLKTSTMPNEVAHEKSCLYVFTNGDSTVQETETSPIHRTDIQNLSKILFQRIQLPIKLFVYILVFNPSTIKSVCEICKGIDEAWDDVKVPLDSNEDVQPNSEFIFISYHESLLLLLEKYFTTNETCTSVVAPVKQISDFFCHFQQGNQNVERWQLPGTAGKVSVKEQDMKIIGKYFDVYYSNRGISKWKSLSSDEMKEQYKVNISSQFLQGHHLTPEALFLHELDVQKIYAKRKIMSTSLSKVRQMLEKLKNFNDVKTPLHRVERNIVQLIHEPSAGGTTVGRIVLWEIRNDYPSVILLNLESNNYQDILDWLSRLFDICQLPLCILIDTSIMTNMRLKDVEKFASDIQEAEVRAAIFFVQQHSEINAGHGYGGRVVQLSLKNKLDEDEKLQFDDLMSRAAQLLKNTPSKTITLYSLCQFGTKYNLKLLEEKLNIVQSKGSCQDKTLLLLSSITFKYSNQPLPFYFAAKIFSTNPEKFYSELDQSLDTLHMARDFIIVQEDEKLSDNFHNGIRPVTSFVSNKILQLVFGDKRNYLLSFITDLLNLLEHSNICDQAITAVTKPLFIQRVITEGTKAQFSKFVIDVEDAVGVNDTVILLTKFANSVGNISTEEGPHVRSMLARYLAYRKGNIDQALKEMHRALNISSSASFSSTKSNDSVLLTTAGSLINLKLRRMANALNKSGEQIATVPAEVASFFEDARLILQKAQKNESNSYPFIIEAQLWYNYMLFYYYGQCQSKPAIFSNLVETTTDDTLKKAAEEAMIKLSLLECLLHKHDMDGFDEKTEEQIADIKMKIVALKIDIQHTQQHIFEDMCKNDPWLARGLVDFYFYNIKCKMSTRQDWDQQKPTFEMLAPQALKTIIEVFTEHISNGLTRANFRHILLALIYIYKQGPRMQYGNLQMAQNFAERWSKDYKDDNRPHYYLALINLIKAMSVDATAPNSSEQRKSFIQKMKESYRKCKELVYKNDSYPKLNVYRRHPREVSFILGDYNNLQALIPKDTMYDSDKVWQESRPRIFTGKARSNDKGHILSCDELQSDVIIPYDIYCKYRMYSKQRPQYWFVLQTRTSGFFVEELFNEKPELSSKNRKGHDNRQSSYANRAAENDA